MVVTDRRRWFLGADHVPYLPTLREAVVDGRRLRICYQGAGDPAPSRRTIDPVGLVDDSGRWYLVAEHRGRLRTYRVSRIADLNVLRDPVRRTDPRPLPEIWRDLRQGFESGRGDAVVLEMAVRAAAARRVRAILQVSITPGTEIERLGEDDNRQRWRVSLRARRPAIGQVMCLADDVVVLGPADFVAELTRTARLVLGQYDEAVDVAPAAPGSLDLG